jgi:hypothetical protein
METGDRGGGGGVTEMDRYYVWEIISYAWTEIGIEVCID